MSLHQWNSQFKNEITALTNKPWMPPSVILTGFVMNTLGISESSSRLVPAVIGIISIPVIYFPTKKEFGTAVGLISVLLLICSRDRPQLLWETIQSILRGDKVPAEMVVIDQSEIPDSNLMNFQSQRNCEICYVWSETKGVSAGRNLAVSIATHPLLVLTDHDMLVTPAWFGRIMRTLLALGPHGVVTGQVLSSKEHKGFAPSTREDHESVLYQGCVNRDVLYTGNMAIYRSAFDRVGGFDTGLGPGTHYPAAEDNDFAVRLLEAGYAIIYDPAATVYHRSWRSAQQSLRLSWNYGCGQSAFHAKYFSLEDPHMIGRMARSVSGYLLRVPYRLFRRPPAQAYRDILYVGGLLYGAARWLIMGGGRA